MGIEADVRGFAEAERAQLARDHRALQGTPRACCTAAARCGWRPTPARSPSWWRARPARWSATPAWRRLRHAGLAPLRLLGLDPDARYRVRLLSPARTAPLTEATASGALLEVMGLPLPMLRAGEVAVFHLERV